MAFDASPSWSGFNYQGKVALYYTLKKINSLPVNGNFSKLYLVLEDNEDFEIRDNSVFVSFHQVKAYNTSSYSQYSDALLEITLELAKKPNVQGKIHTWKQINPKENYTGIIDSLKSDIQLILDEYRHRSSNSGNTIIEKAVAEEGNRPKRAAIIKAALPNHSELIIYNLLSDIVLSRNNAISRLKAYVYDDGNSFCDLKDINLKIESEISLLLSKRQLTNTSERVKKTLHYFLSMMDKYIIERHKAKKEEDKLSISFVEIIDAVTQDHEDIGLDYLSYAFKSQFAYLMDEYISDPSLYQETDGKCNLKESKNFLLNLEPIELWAYYRNFCPHINLQEVNNTDNAINIDKNGIRFVLLKILNELDYDCISNIKEKSQILYKKSASAIKSFIPSTIMVGVPLPYIERQIISNCNMWEFLFEIGNIIYDGSDVHVFSPSAATHTEAPIGVDEDTRSKRNDMLKNISLVPISEVKEELSS